MATIIRQRSTSWRAALAVGFLALLLGVAYAVLLAQPIRSILLFLVFQIVGVALPGLALTKLFGLRLYALEALTISYGMGILVQILLYFLLVPAGWGRFIPVAVVALGVLAAVTLWRFRRRPLAVYPDKGRLPWGLAVVAFASILAFLVLSATTLDPGLSGARTFHHDLLYGVGMVTSVAEGIPNKLLQMAGAQRIYHVFYYAYAHMVKSFIGATSFDVATKYTMITLSPLFAAAFCCLAARVVKKCVTAAVSTVAVFLTSRVLLHYLSVDTLGYPMAAAFSVLSLLLFLHAQQMPARFFNRYHVLSAIFLVGVVGAKGPVAVTCVFGMCFALLLQLSRKKESFRRVMSTGLLLAVAFFVPYLLFYSGSGSEMALRSVNNPVPGTALTWIPEGWPPLLRIVIAVIADTVQNSPLLLPALVVAGVGAFRLRDVARQTLYRFTAGALIIGFALRVAVVHIGASEVYFLYAAIPAAFLVLGHAAETALLTLLRRRRAVLAGVVGLVVAAVCAAESVPGIQMVAGSVETARTYSRFSDSRLMTAEQADGLENPVNWVTRQEYEGFLWLRDNTPPGTIYVEGRTIIHNKYCYPSAFSERYSFLESWGQVTLEDTSDLTPEKARRMAMLKGLYEDHDEVWLMLLRRDGVAYVILTRYTSPGWRLTYPGVELVFENEDIAIYDIRNVAI